MKKVALALVGYVKKLLALEPVVCIGVLASAVCVVAAHFGIVLHHSQVATVVALLVSALLSRRVVVPASKVKS